jgi:hypothetical protein
MAQEFEDLKKRVQHIEDEMSDWQHWKAITRDSAHKIGIAEGLATTMQGDMIQLKVDVAKVSRQVATVLDNQYEMDKKLDLILGFLSPKQS